MYWSVWRWSWGTSPHSKGERMETECFEERIAPLMVNEFGAIHGDKKKKNLFGRIFDGYIIDLSGIVCHLDRVIEAVYIEESDTLLLVEQDGTRHKVMGFDSNMDCNLRDLYALVKYLKPDLSEYMYYSDMGGVEIVHTALWGESPPELKRADDTDISKFRYMIESCSRELNIEAKFSRLTMMDVWNMVCTDNVRNLWLEWLEDLEWDGVPRLDRWFIDRMGASAPALKDKEKELRYLTTVTRAWFMGGVARGYKETKHEIVPILIGAQGIGKSGFIRYTAYEDDWYRETMSNFEDDKEFAERTFGSKIIELAESKQLRTSSVEAIKMYISKSSDMFREAYARKSKVFRRHWIMIASSNESKLFIDKTGNRRFFPMFCDPEKITINYWNDMEERYEAKQVWAEAKVLYDQGNSWIFGPKDEINELAQIMQKNSTYDEDVWIAIDEYLDNPDNNLVAVGSKISKRDIYTVILGEDYRKPSKEVKYAVNSWVENNCNWKNNPDLERYKNEFAQDSYPTRNVLTRVTPPTVV